jgi:DNA helicase-2/ATP-dependent DNA helicase PcrA
VRAGEVDLAGRPAVRCLLALMRAVADPLDVAALREALLAPWWDAPLFARARFLRQTSDRELAEAFAGAFPAIAETLEALRAAALEMPPLSLFSLLLVRSGARDYLLAHAETLEEDVPLVRQLLRYVEDLVARHPNATFADVLGEFAQAREHDIGSLKTTHTEAEGRVTVITAHKAKGMEFSLVFVTALTAREWEGRGASALIPSPFDAAREREELIRLFYVACTRAKDVLTLSYALENGEGREEAPMSLLPAGLERVDVPVDPLPRLFAATAGPALVRDLTGEYLAHDGLSPSAYNEYLASPPTFFAKRVLRLAEPETRAIAVGNAVHAALAAYLNTHGAEEDARRGAARAELSRAFARSLLPRGDTFDALVRHGRSLLAAALDAPFFAAVPLAVEETFRITRRLPGREVVLKGKLDALVETAAGACIVDFKTSSTISREDRARFERQIAFYDLVLRGNGHASVSGKIVQITEDGVKEHAFPLTDALRAELAETLDTVLAELIAGTWRPGASSDYDALLALFA